MEIKLTTQESEDIFYSSLCNALGTGYMQSYGLEMECDRSQYKSSRDHLIHVTDSAPCYEDVLMQVLRDGGKLTFVDVECDGEYTSSITLADVHARVQTVDPNTLLTIREEQDDASDADVVLQTVFFGEVIFG